MKQILKHVYQIGLILLLIGTIQKANAQDTAKEAQPIQSLNKIKLSLLGLFYEREQLVATSTTVYGGIGLGSGISYSYNNWSGSKWAFSMSPSAYIGVKNYYKLEQRAKKGRETRNNSTNFFGVLIGGSTKAVIEKNAITKAGMGLEAFWGIQRSLGKKINFELQLGPMLATDFDEVKFHPVSGRLGFSYIL